MIWLPITANIVKFWSFNIFTIWQLIFRYLLNYPQALFLNIMWRIYSALASSRWLTLAISYADWVLAVVSYNPPITKRCGVNNQSDSLHAGDSCFWWNMLLEFFNLSLVLVCYSSWLTAVVIISICLEPSSNLCLNLDSSLVSCAYSCLWIIASGINLFWIYLNISPLD